MAIAPQHLPKCLVSSPTAGMIRVIADQLLSVTLRCTKAILKMINVVADLRDVYSSRRPTTASDTAVREGSTKDI